MALALQRRLAPAEPDLSQAEATDPKLDVSVVFTSVDATLAALTKAAAVAGRLSVPITLVVPQIVPYPLPLSSPPVLLDFNEKRFTLIATQSPVETTVLIYLCRDRWDALTAVLKPHSVVVLGGRKRWWPTRETRLAWRLRRAGHEVILTEME